MNPTDGVVIVEQHVVFTFTELCRGCAAEPERLSALVEEGLLRPEGARPEDWRFGGEALARVRLALRLSRDLDLSAPGTAMVIELLDEIERLRQRLGRAGLGQGRPETQRIQAVYTARPNGARGCTSVCAAFLALFHPSRRPRCSAPPLPLPPRPSPGSPCRIRFSPQRRRTRRKRPTSAPAGRWLKR